MKKQLSIEGMTCDNCKRHVTEALREIDGVTSIAVNLADKNAVVEIDGEIEEEVLRRAVAEAGYVVTEVS